MRDICAFYEWLAGRAVTKSIVIAYKQYLMQKLPPGSVNSVSAKVKLLSVDEAVFSFYNIGNCAQKVRNQLVSNKRTDLPPRVGARGLMR